MVDTHWVCQTGPQKSIRWLIHVNTHVIAHQILVIFSFWKWWVPDQFLGFPFAISCFWPAMGVPLLPAALLAAVPFELRYATSEVSPILIVPKIYNQIYPKTVSKT